MKAGEHQVLPVTNYHRVAALAIRARATGKEYLPVPEEQEIGARGDA